MAFSFVSWLAVNSVNHWHDIHCLSGNAWWIFVWTRRGAGMTFHATFIPHLVRWGDPLLCLVVRWGSYWGLDEIMNILLLSLINYLLGSWAIYFSALVPGGSLLTWKGRDIISCMDIVFDGVKLVFSSEDCEKVELLYNASRSIGFVIWIKISYSWGNNVMLNRFIRWNLLG